MFQRVEYKDLNSRQQEIFNFQKISSVLAEYGYLTMRLSDDWQGADFIALHFNNQSVLRVQLKGRLEIAKKYLGKDLWVCFRDGEDVYLYKHDEMAAELLSKTTIGNTESWKRKDGGYSCNSITKKLASILEQHKLCVYR